MSGYIVKFANGTKLSCGGIWRKELRNGLSLADDDIIRGGLGLVTYKTKKKKNKPNPQQEPLAYGARLMKSECYRKSWNTADINHEARCLFASMRKGYDVTGCNESVTQETPQLFLIFGRSDLLQILRKPPAFSFLIFCIIVFKLPHIYILFYYPVRLILVFL